MYECDVINKIKFYWKKSEVRRRKMGDASDIERWIPLLREPVLFFREAGVCFKKVRSPKTEDCELRTVSRELRTVNREL